MLEILLIRHGQTDWNVEQRIMGRKPIPLNAVGRRQAEGVADFLAGGGLKAVISSPVLRALETARIIASRQQGVEVEEEPSLSEIDYGDWVNLTFAELINKDGKRWRLYHEDPNDVILPGGESIRDVATRVVALLTRVRERFADGRVALVSHADVIKIALISLFNFDLKNLMRFSVDNGAVLLVRFHPEIGPRLVMYNAMNGFGRDM